MSGKSTMRTRLCPNCANSVQEDAMNCPYCKADLSSDSPPEWLNRDDPSPDTRLGSKQSKRSSIPAKFIWPAAMVLVALTAYFAGGYMHSGELSRATQAHLKELQAKDQMILSQESQLAQTKQQLNESSTQLADLKTKLEEGQKELSAIQQRLSSATRENNRLTATRSVAVTRSASRAPYAAASYPAPATPRRSAEPGVYETTQSTSVYEGPSASSRVIKQIGRGTRINVVSNSGAWLEVRSKHGNPPGYVPSGDARQVSRVN